MKTINHITFLVLLFLLISSNNAKAQNNFSVTQNGELAVRIEGETYVCLSVNGQVSGFGVAGNGLVSYFDNHVDRIGSVSISYFDGKIDRIGSTSVSYFNGNVDRVGNESISYFDGRVDRIGTYSLSYFNGKIDRIGMTSISTVSNQDLIIGITLHGNCAY